MRKYILLILILSLLSNCSHFDVRLRSTDSIREQCLRDFPIGTDKEEVKRRLLGYFPKTSDYREYESYGQNNNIINVIKVTLSVHYYILLPIETDVFFIFDIKTNKLIEIEVYKNIIS